MLVRPNPFGKTKCEGDKCSICNEEGNINCKQREVVYKIQCSECKGNNEGLYIGETARSVSERYNEHTTKYKNKDRSSPFYQHMLEKHEGEMKNIKLKVISKHSCDAMLRQVNEAERIRIEEP